MKPSKIGQFQVQSLIAEGGQAKVYKAFKNNSVYAIKVYHFKSQKDDLLFFHEKQLMQSINHTRIFYPLQYRADQTVTHDDKTSQKKNIVIMRYMKNGDLMNFVIKYGKIDTKIILRLVKSIIDCLQYLSQQGIFHCDIKPQNLLLNQQYETILIDFGFIASKFSTREKDYPRQYYIAPEVKKGQPHTEKSQAFSLGVLIFILFMGCLPFKYTKHTDTSYRSLLQGKHQIFWKNFQQNINSPLNQNLKKAIINLLQPNPKRRWGFSELKESEWFDEDVISQKEYFQYFNYKLQPNSKRQKQFSFTDNESTGSKQMEQQKG